MNSSFIVGLIGKFQVNWVYLGLNFSTQFEPLRLYSSALEWLTRRVLPEVTNPQYLVVKAESRGPVLKIVERVSFQMVPDFTPLGDVLLQLTDVTDKQMDVNVTKTFTCMCIEINRNMLVLMYLFASCITKPKRE